MKCNTAPEAVAPRSGAQSFRHLSKAGFYCEPNVQCNCQRDQRKVSWMDTISVEFCQIGPGSWLATDALPSAGEGSAHG